MSALAAALDAALDGLWADAACGNPNYDPSWWDSGSPHRQRAIAICTACPIRLDCLQHAMDNTEPFGTWGGLTERERRRLHAVINRRPARP